MREKWKRGCLAGKPEFLPLGRFGSSPNLLPRGATEPEREKKIGGRK